MSSKFLPKHLLESFQIRLKAKELYNQFNSKIQAIYDVHEASSITYIVLDHFGVSKIDIALNEEVTFDFDQLNSIQEQLLQNIPVQYILNEAWFYDRKFEVSPDTLIPRSETEELCAEIVDQIHSNFPNKKDQHLTLLDIGTGSGCIPITLKLECPELEVFTVDTSLEALNVAKRNAQQLSAPIQFLHHDILSVEQLTQIHPSSSFQIIVSNPPYVRYSEQQQMLPNVLENEPHLALFVEDQDPLIFYRTICKLASDSPENEMVFFEINEAYGEEVSALLSQHGYLKTCIKKDLQGKDRIVYGSRFKQV